MSMVPLPWAMPKKCDARDKDQDVDEQYGTVSGDSISGDAALYLSDLERKPEVLDVLAQRIDAGDFVAGVPDDVDRVLFLGMGSSTYAASVVAAQLRARGIDAVAELASSDLLPPADPRTLVVAISASGGSLETLSAASSYAGRAPLVAVTNVELRPSPNVRTLL